MPRRDPDPEVRAAERAVADDAGTQQRRGRLVGEGVRDAVRVPLVDHRELGVAAVGVPAREPRIDAEVLVAAAQKRQVPHVERSHAMPMRSPSAKRRAPGPSGSTTPTTSCPGTTSGRAARDRPRRGGGRSDRRRTSTRGRGPRPGRAPDRAARPHQRAGVDGPGRWTTHARMRSPCRSRTAWASWPTGTLRRRSTRPDAACGSGTVGVERVEPPLEQAALGVVVDERRAPACTRRGPRRSRPRRCEQLGAGGVQVAVVVELERVDDPQRRPRARRPRRSRRRGSAPPPASPVSRASSA